KNAYWERRCVGINTYIGSTKSREAWKIIRSLRTNEKSNVNLQLISQGEWQNYYSKLLKEEREEFIQSDETERGEGTYGNVEDITSEEIQNVVKSLQNGSSALEIQQRVQKGKIAIRQLHSILWNKTINKDVKRMIYKTIVESIVLYGAEVWEIPKKSENKLKAMEMDFWRRSCSVSRLERIQNQSIRERMQVSSINIMDTIEGRRLTWYGHLRRMPTDRWPLKIYNWIPPRRKKRGRPRLSWNDNVRQLTKTGKTEKDGNVDAEDAVWCSKPPTTTKKFQTCENNLNLRLIGMILPVAVLLYQSEETGRKDQI
ncbi:hypothetical protein C0J52_12701, partial [Blattella germanica]